MVSLSTHYCLYFFTTFFKVICIPLLFFFVDSEVGKIFTQISVTESEAFIKLNETDFYEKKLINLRKKWILEGLDPDEEEARLLKKNLNKQKKNKKKRIFHNKKNTKNST